MQKPHTVSASRCVADNPCNRPRNDTAEDRTDYGANEMKQSRVSKSRFYFYFCFRTYLARPIRFTANGKARGGNYPNVR